MAMAGLDEDEVEAVGGDDRACRCMVVEGCDPLVVLGDRAVLDSRSSKGAASFGVLYRFAILRQRRSGSPAFSSFMSCIW